MAVKQDSDAKFDALLAYLKRSRGFDFSRYKTSSLMRRIRKRMQLVNMSDFVEYVDYLEVHPDEFEQLFNTILINVTSFFRDPESWDYIKDKIIPEIIENNKPDGEIRVWSAGCASGEETYTIAILLCEALGQTQFRQRVKIYATDVDEEALEEARQAAYIPADVENIPHDLLQKYFTLIDHKYVFRADLRRSVIYGRHDLGQDAPISHLDLLICRNTLMYLNAETQARILARFHFALKPDGFLFLGKAEMLLSYGSLFRQIDLQYRMFAKVSKLGFRDRLLSMGQNSIDANKYAYINHFNKLREKAFDRALIPQLVLDKTGYTILINEAARRTFKLSTDDIGRPLRDLEISYRPVELRSLIDQSVNERRPVRSGRVATQGVHGIDYIEAVVTPLMSSGDQLIGTTIAFHDISKIRTLNAQLQSAQEELETTNEELQATNEELETTNEELQSTNEELETTIEELQSCNEELETTNEELQSTNEELETTSTELAKKTRLELDLQSFLAGILSGLPYGVMVIDGKNKILLWSPGAEDLWGLRADEVVGQDFASLDIGLPVEKVIRMVAGFKKGKSHEEATFEAHNRRGRKIGCALMLSPLSSEYDGGEGLVILMDERSTG